MTYNVDGINLFCTFLAIVGGAFLVYSFCNGIHRIYIKFKNLFYKMERLEEFQSAVEDDLRRKYNKSFDELWADLDNFKKQYPPRKK